jgi:ubiquinone biosynthesis protein
MFSDAFCAELAKLHSSVTPFPGDEAVRIVEAELGARISDVFQSFDEAPIAAGSIAQVHFAVLKTGEPVAVKVQRPDAHATVRADLDMVLTTAKWLDRLFATAREAMVHRMAQEFASTTSKELNFLEEAATAHELKEALAIEPRVHIPTFYRHICTTRVLVMERFVAHRLDTFRDEQSVRDAGFDPEQIARTMLILQVRMAYEIGLLHVDMHPGNIFLLPGDRLGLIDFGMATRIPRDIRDKMLRALRLRAASRYEECFDVFTTIFDTPPGTDLRGMKQEFVAFARANDAKPLSEATLARALIEESRIGRRYGATAPSELLLVARGLLNVEGIALRLCPGFKPYVELEAVFKRLLQERFAPERIARSWWDLVPDLLDALDTTPELNKTLLRLRRNLGASTNLKEFLAAEGLTSAPTNPPRRSGISAALLLGLAAAAAAGFALARLTGHG